MTMTELLTALRDRANERGDVELVHKCQRAIDKIGDTELEEYRTLVAQANWSSLRQENDNDKIPL
jgi:hypothetical protein